MLREEQLSFSVWCMFVRARAFDFFDCLYEAGNFTLFLFEDHGPTFYETETIQADPKQPYVLQHKQYLEEYEESLSSSSDNKKKKVGVFPIELTQHLFPLLLQWQEWLPLKCPIRFDVVPPREVGTITCGHGFCRSCLSTYLKLKAEEIDSH